MARGTTLTNLLSMLNGEIGNAGATNTSRDAILSIALSNKQKAYATQYDWPFLEDRWNVNVAPSTQYVNYPTLNDEGETSSINLERMPIVEVQWTLKWNPVQYGIGSQEYNALDFSQGQASDPIQKWRMATNVTEPANPNVFEVWPVPVSLQIVRFTGQRTLLPLSAGADVADLDDMLLVLSVAADYLKRAKQADWEDKTLQAKRHFQFLRQAYPTEDKKTYLGGGSANQKDRKLVGLLIATR